MNTKNTAVQYPTVASVLGFQPERVGTFQCLTAPSPYAALGLPVNPGVTTVGPFHTTGFGTVRVPTSATEIMGAITSASPSSLYTGGAFTSRASAAAEIGGLFSRAKEEGELKEKIDSLLRDNGALLAAKQKTSEEADRLRVLAAQQSADLETKRRAEADLEEKLLELQEQQKASDQKNDELNKQVKIFKFLRHLMRPDAIASLQSGGDLAEAFSANSTTCSYVMSVDIRRSTELMLKARSADSFANFISDLCQELKTAVAHHYGVVDKFTGDGILAYFPTFYSGPDAGLHCLTAAQECHGIFDRIYRRHHSGFDSVLLDVGLGIGIDFGNIKIVHMGDELSIVGKPVVYACRLGGAPAGNTLANNGAIEALSTAHAGQISAQEVVLDIKNEGRVLTYQVRVNQGIQAPKEPDWKLALTTKQSSPDENPRGATTAEVQATMPPPALPSSAPTTPA